MANKMVTLRRREKTTYDKYRTSTGETYEVTLDNPKRDEADILVGWRSEIRIAVYEMTAEDFMAVAVKRYLED